LKRAEQDGQQNDSADMKRSSSEQNRTKRNKEIRTRKQENIRRELTIMKVSLGTAFFLLTIIMVASLSKGATGRMKVCKPNLPKTIGVWTRPDSPRVINSQNIFDYMNGAGELYLGYRFNHLEVYEYTANNEKSILVELYCMKTSDDAFGLLSLDWGGEHVSFRGFPANTSSQSLTSSTRALFGGGLLRIWSDNLYARIMAFRETPASKQAVLALGQAITANRKSPPEPELLQILPLHIGSTWKLRKDRLSFFRSYLVLNSIYYLSQGNILDLDLSTEAVTAPYEHISSSRDRRRSQFLLVKYEDHERSRKALNHFHDAYLPEHKKEFTADSAAKSPSLFKLEDGWMAYTLVNKYIAIVFECPDRESARIIIQNSESNVRKNGGYHEG
jgi:hypothetical protein